MVLAVRNTRHLLHDDELRIRTDSILLYSKDRTVDSTKCTNEPQ